MANLTTRKLKIPVKERKVGDYENTSRQQLESLFIIPSLPTPAPRPATRPKRPKTISAPRPDPIS